MREIVIYQAPWGGTPQFSALEPERRIELGSKMRGRNLDRLAQGFTLVIENPSSAPRLPLRQRLGFGAHERPHPLDVLSRIVVKLDPLHTMVGEPDVRDRCDAR